MEAGWLGANMYRRLLSEDVRRRQSAANYKREAFSVAFFVALHRSEYSEHISAGIRIGRVSICRQPVRFFGQRIGAEGSGRR